MYAHRFNDGKQLTGMLWLLTGGVLGLGYLYDWLTLNELVDEANAAAPSTAAAMKPAY